MPTKNKISKPQVAKVFVIAEAGVNHNRSLKTAKQLVVAAAKAGADAIKFQTFQTASLVTQSARQAEYQKANLGITTSQAEMLRKLEMTAVMHFQLKKLADKMRIEFLSTAFDEASLDFLTDNFKLKFLKIPSGEITNAPFLLKIARKQLPVILSTGMSTMKEVVLTRPQNSKTSSPRNCANTEAAPVDKLTIGIAIDIGSTASNGALCPFFDLSEKEKR